MKKKYLQPKTAKITFNYSEIVAASIIDDGGDVGWEDDDDAMDPEYADRMIVNDLQGNPWNGEE